MGETVKYPFVLLGCFAEFYEEVAGVKLAIDQGRLSAYLGIEGQTPAPTARELAERVSSRLLGILRNRSRNLKQRATAVEVAGYASAEYVMVAVADEIFLLEVDWPGREPWFDFLLEHRLFGTRMAGRRFFERATEVLKESDQLLPNVDLASVFLLALQLGFKGVYRGKQGISALNSVRDQLLRFVYVRTHEDGEFPAFPQAYEQEASDRKDVRLAPLDPWRRRFAQCLVAYLAISTVAWFAWIYYFNQTAGG